MAVSAVAIGASLTGVIAMLTVATLLTAPEASRIV
jgi:hypothetical protein